MDKELEKRLEETIEKYVCINGAEDYQKTYDTIRQGAELGFKEAITQAKEWLKRKDKELWESYGLPFSIADFEEYMNNLLRE